jgi:hypothetical protein
VKRAAAADQIPCRDLDDVSEPDVLGSVLAALLGLDNEPILRLRHGDRVVRARSATTMISSTGSI